MSIVGPILVVNSLGIVINMEVLKKQILCESIKSCGGQECSSVVLIVSIVDICYFEFEKKDDNAPYELTRTYVLPCYHCFCDDCIKQSQHNVSFYYV